MKRNTPCKKMYRRHVRHCQDVRHVHIQKINIDDAATFEDVRSKLTTMSLTTTARAAITSAKMYDTNDRRRHARRQCPPCMYVSSCHVPQPPGINRTTIHQPDLTPAPTPVRIPAWPPHATGAMHRRHCQASYM